MIRSRSHIRIACTPWHVLVTCMLVVGACGDNASSRPEPIAIEATAATSSIQGMDFDLAMVASGGHGGVVWSVSSGQLPPGLALTDISQRTLHVSGRPSRAGAFAFDLEVQDDEGQRATRSVALTVESSLAIDGDALPDGSEDAPYQAQLSAVGGSDGYRWRISAGDVPPGLAVSGEDTPTLTLAGTPMPGRFAFTVTVADADSVERSREVVLWVHSALAIEGDPQPALIGDAFDLPLHVRGGVGPYAWHIVAGSITGLALTADGADAHLQGVPSVPGTTTLAIEVTDHNEGRIARTLNVDLRDRLQVVTDTLPSGQQGTEYSAEIMGAGGLESAYHWKVVAGALPGGVTLAPEGAPSAALTGTPTADGSFTFTVELSTPTSPPVDRALTIQIRNNPPQLAGKTLAAGVWGQDYADAITGTSRVGGPVQWKLIDGWLPPGVTLEATSAAAVAVAGRPALSGSFDFTLQMTDAGGVAQARFLIDIAAVDPFQLVARTLPRGRVGDPYNAALQTRNAAGEVSWQIASGELPAGVVLETDGPRARLVGAPTSAGFYRFAIEATANGQTSSRNFAMQVRPVTSWALVAHGDDFDGPYSVSVADVTNLPATTVVVQDGLRGWVSSLTVSPDGRYATFVSGDLNLASLFLVDLRGGPHPAVLLTTSLDGGLSQPVTWSPDGAFALVPVRVAELEFDMHLLDLSGTEASFRSLGVARASAQRAWSPDANQLAFVSPLGDILYVAKRSNASWSMRAIPTGTTAVWPLHWLPDSSAVMFSGSGKNQGLYLVDVTAADPLPMPLMRPRTFFNSNLDSVSDDGTRVLFTDCCGSLDAPHIWALDISRQALAQPVAMNIGLQGQVGAQWFPDSRHLLFGNQLDSNLYVIDTDAPPGAPPPPLPVTGLDGPLRTVIWTPDGRSLIATTDTAVYQIPLDAPTAEPLLGGLFRFPRTWFLGAPSPFVFIEDGTLQAIDLSISAQRRQVLRIDTDDSGNHYYRQDPLRKRIYYEDLHVDHHSLYIVDVSGPSPSAPIELLRVSSPSKNSGPSLGNIGFSD